LVLAPLTGLGQSAVVAACTTKMTRLTKAQILATADHQISLTDPDARSMATSGRGSGVVGLCASRVRSQLANVATKQTKAALGVASLDAIADRGYFISAEILECETRTSPPRCRSR
jgi:hypothetical protein